MGLVKKRSNYYSPYYIKKNKPAYQIRYAGLFLFFVVVLLRLELRLTEPESAVLPLHHKTVCIARLKAMQKYGLFFYFAINKK